jgi:hypothetical protein
MLTTPHTAAGIAIGSLIGVPWLVAPVAISSHFVLDMIPHWQETLAPYTPTKKTYIRIPIDIVLSVSITLLAIHWQSQDATAIWVGTIFANLPDFDSLVVLAPSLNKGMIKKFWDWHCAIQRETKSLWGIVPQLLLIAFCLTVIKLV